MSAPQSGRKGMVTIAATVPHDLLAELRRYCDLHRVTVSQLVREGLQLRMGSREDCPADELRYDMAGDLEVHSFQLAGLEERLQTAEAALQQVHAQLASHDEALRQRASTELFSRRRNGTAAVESAPVAQKR